MTTFIVIVGIVFLLFVIFVLYALVASNHKGPLREEEDNEQMKALREMNRTRTGDQQE